MTRIPGPESSEEERRAFFSKLAPKSPDEYEFNFAKPANEGEEPPVSQEVLSEFAQKAHEAGLTPQQAEELGRWSFERSRAKAQERADQFNKGMEQLRQEFGDQGLEQRKRLARAVVDKYGMEGSGEMLAEAIEQNPGLIALLGNVGEQFGEAIDSGVHRDRSDVGMWTRTEMEKRMNEIRSDKAFTDVEDPRHATLMKEYERLGEAYYGRGEAVNE